MSERKPKKQPAKVPQRHGGALNSGGTPGNPGGGRPPQWLRDRLLAEAEKRVHVFTDVADGRVTYALEEVCEHCGKAPSGAGPTKFDAFDKAPSASERVRAMAEMLRYGLGERSEFAADVVSANVDKMLQTAQALMTPEDFAVYCKQADAIWNGGKHG